MSPDLLFTLGVICLVVGLLGGFSCWVVALLQAEAPPDRRSLLQRNLHELVVARSEADEHESADWLLRAAFQDTLREYRSL